MSRSTRNRKVSQSSDDIPPEGKFLKKGWSSRDEQRWNRKGYKRLVKHLVALEAL